MAKIVKQLLKFCIGAILEVVFTAEAIQVSIKDVSMNRVWLICIQEHHSAFHKELLGASVGTNPEVCEGKEEKGKEEKENHWRGHVLPGAINIEYTQ